VRSHRSNDIDIKYVFLFTLNDTDEGIHPVESPLVHEKILNASSHYIR
jgi:hypothetical protein